MRARSRLAGLLVAAVTASLLAAMPTSNASASTPFNLKVGSFNIRSVQYDNQATTTDRPWKQRRSNVVRDILGENVDVVGIQEASQNPMYASQYVDGGGIVQGTRLQTQYFDLLNGLNAKTTGRPWALTNRFLYNCVRLDNNWNCVKKYRGASRGTKIFYRNDRLKMLSQGSYQFQHQTGTTNDERYFVWAKFQIRATGKQFFFATTHLANSTASLIKAEWQEVITQINAHKGALPVVMTGDFQVMKFDKPTDTMLGAMRSNGYGDVVNQRYGTAHLTWQRAQVMRNGWINTMNQFRRDVRQYSFDDNRALIGDNVDWIFATNALVVKRWKVVAHYDPKTLQLTGVIPSDHNMVSSMIAVP